MVFSTSNPNDNFQNVRKIPNCIYTGFPNIYSMNDLFKENFERIKELNPNYSHTIFTDSMQVDFIEENFGKEMLNRYLSIHQSYGAARSDFFRILLLYKKGGIWMDSKSTVRTNFDLIITNEDRLVLSNWTKWHSTSIIEDPKKGSYREIVNWFIASEPAHEILEIAVQSILSNISKYNPLRSGFGKSAALMTTGPIAFTKAIHDDLNPNNHRMIDSYDAGIRFTIFNSWEGHYNFIPNNYRISKKPLVNRNLFIDSLVIVPFCLHYSRAYVNLIKKRVVKIINNFKLPK